MPMVVVITRDVESRYRGFLGSAMLELAPGWGSGKGAGNFTMSAADKSCLIGFANIIDDKKKTSIPATQVVISRAPKSGKVSVTGKGLIYSPASGFKGRDSFCTKNTSPKVRGTVLSGCITVTVR